MTALLSSDPSQFSHYIVYIKPNCLKDWTTEIAENLEDDGTTVSKEDPRKSETHAWENIKLKEWVKENIPIDRDEILWGKSSKP